MKRVLSIILVAIMCLSLLPAVVASAADDANASATVTNLFELKGYGTPNETSVDGDLTANVNFISSKAIAVAEGDVINIAPVVQAQTFQAVIYKTDAEGKVTTERVTLSTAGVTTELLGDSAESPAIMKYTISAGVTHIAPVGSQMYEESYTVTKNQALTKDICFGMWSDSAMKMFNNGNTTPVADIVNLFSDDEGGCGVNMGEAHSSKTGGLGTNVKYRGTKNAIPVTRDDVIYFVGQTPTGGYTGHFISTFKADGTGIANLKHAYVSVYANIGNNYVVYAYRAPAGVASVRISSTTSNFCAGIILATKNQPFDGATLKAWCDLNGSDYNIVIDGESLPKVEVDTESPLYKKTVLFAGDSITYGLGEEWFNTYLPRRAWAGRLAEKYAMTVVNAGNSGARISFTKSGKLIADGLYSWTAEEKPDMVVMHGGVNDARYNDEVEIGTVDSTDTLTFCGGLNRTFKIAKNLYPDADLFYIANFYIPEEKGTVSSMGEYYALAKQICENHGVTYIDLAGNTELNDILANKDADGNPQWNKYMPDKLHPNAAGYDVITPYIAAALEAFYAPPAEEDPKEDPAETTTLGGETTTAPSTTAPSTTAAPAEEKSCGGFSAVSVAAAVAVSVLGAAITVIKKK